MKKQNPSSWHVAFYRFVWLLCCLKFTDHQLLRWLATVLLGLLWIGTANEAIAQNLPVISITPDAATAVEGSTDASFTLSADPAPTAELMVEIIVRESGNNFTAVEGSNFVFLTLNDGQTSVNYTVSLLNDDTDEPSGLLRAVIFASTIRSYTTASNESSSILLLDDDPTVVALARTGSGIVDEGSTVAFTVTLGRALVADEIIDVPLIISGTGITTTDWSLATKSGATLNTGITLVNTTTLIPVVRFSGAGAQTATLLLTAAADNTAETDGSETLTLKLGPNDDTANGFDFKDRMTNVGGGADPAADAADNTFNVTINDTFAPVINSNAMMSVAEGTTTVLTVMATDADKDDLTYSISAGADSVQFSINQNSGALTFKTVPDFEAPDSTDKDNVYEMEVTVSDGTYNTRQTLTITVTDVNEPPMLAPTATKSIAENVVDVLTVIATDPDTGTTLTYSITGGADSTRFSIDQSTGDLTFKTAPDFEAGSADGDDDYEVEVSANDGTNSAMQTITVTVTDENDNPPMITSPATASVAENTIDVVTVTATDEDTGTTLNYSITGGADSARFSIDQSTGDLTFKTAPDFEAGSADGDDDYEVIVTVSDGTNMDMQTITVTVTDENDNTPIITSPATASIAENTTDVLTVTATDEDAGTTLTYSISGGADRALFNIDRTSGVLTFITVPDFEMPDDQGSNNEYVVEVTASDGTNSDMQTITVTVTDDPADNILGFSEAKEAAVIFPNPSGDYLEVRSFIGGTFQLLSLSGKPLLKGTTNTRIDISSLQSGLYLIQLPDGRLLKFVRE